MADVKAAEMMSAGPLSPRQHLGRMQRASPSPIRNHVTVSGSRGTRAMASADQLFPPKLQHPSSPELTRSAEDASRPRPFMRSESQPLLSSAPAAVSPSLALGHIDKRRSLHISRDLVSPRPRVPPSMRRINEYRLVMDKVVMAQCVLRTYLARRAYRDLLRNELKRHQVAEEVLTTERTYAAGLEELQRCFLVPLTALESILPELSKLTAEVQVISSYSSVVLKELERRLLEWSFTSQLGDLFLQVADFMKAYTQYIQTYNKFRRTLAENRQSSQLSGLLDACAASVGNKTIGTFLIMPIQRLPRYQMLLQTLLKNTATEHVDHTTMLLAHQKILGVASYLDEREQEYENVSKVLSVQDRCSGIQNLALPHRKFVKEGAFVETHGSSSRRRYGFLFNDLFLVTKESRDGKRNSVLLKLQVSSIVLVDIEASSEREGHALVLHVKTSDSQAKLTLCFPSAEEKKDWKVTICRLQVELSKLSVVGNLESCQRPVQLKRSTSKLAKLLRQDSGSSPSRSRSSPGKGKSSPSRAKSSPGSKIRLRPST